MITIYTTTACPKCTATRRQLAKQGLSYNEVPITPEIADQLKADGYTQAPVIVTDTASWDGFRPDKIKQLNNYTIAAPGRDSASPVIIAQVEHHSV